MAETTASKLATRLGALTAGFIVVGAFVALLAIYFQPAAYPGLLPTFTFASLTLAAPRAAPKIRPGRKTAPAAPDIAASARAPDALPADQARLRAALACLNPKREERPAYCADLWRTDRPDEFDPRARLPLRDTPKAPMRPLNLDGIFTRAEQKTIVMPLCEGVCITLGKPPPPQVRTPEQICRDAGLGPCTPPPFRPQTRATTTLPLAPP